MRHIAAALWVLSACGGGLDEDAPTDTDIEPTLVLRGRSEAELLRLMDAGTGGDARALEIWIEFLDDDYDPDPCPLITVAGKTATITGGCTRLDGTEIQGYAVVTNPFAWRRIDHDPSSERVYEAHQLTLTNGSWTTIYDGIVRYSYDLNRFDADVTLSDDGMTVRTDLAYACTWPICTFAGGIELIGGGGAHVSGWSNDDYGPGEPMGEFSLRGANQLTYRVFPTCTEWWISNTSLGHDCP